MKKESKNVADKTGLYWKIHLPNMLQEIAQNGGPGVYTLKIPLQILGSILYELGEVASEINNPQLNAIMMQLTIYSIADPESSEYKPGFATKYMNQHLRPKKPTPNSQPCELMNMTQTPGLRD